MHRSRFGLYFTGAYTVWFTLFFLWYLSCEGSAKGNGGFGPRIIGCDIFLFIATLPIVAVGSFISFFVIPTELLTFLFARRVD